MERSLILPFLAISLAIVACNDQRKTLATQATTTIDEPRAAKTELVLNGAGGPSIGDSLFLSFERTPCFGTCKAYRINIYKSGHATYDGRSNVELLGPHTGRVSGGVIEELVAQVEGSGFFAMQDKYDAEVTDLPSTIIRVVANGKDKKVIGRVGQPAAFKNLAAQLEERLLAVDWKPARNDQ